jgi:PAS domain S-box-containing protein
LSAQSTNPPQAEIQRFLLQLRGRRDRLVALAGGAETDLARAVDEVDEELRVQTEQLERSTQQLDALVGAYEDLFANAPIAYLQTDADGLILRMNRAAARLIGVVDVSRRSRTLPGLVRPVDRSAVRAVLSRLRAAEGRSSAGAHEPIEAAIARPDGTQARVVLVARRSRDAEEGRLVVHWEARVPGRAASPASQPRTTTLRTTPAVSAVSGAAVELASQTSPDEVLYRAVELARRLVGPADEAGLAVIRSSGVVATTAASGEVARLVEEFQVEVDEGPGLSAFRMAEAVHVPDLARDERWPLFDRRALGLGVRCVAAVPLVGPKGAIGALTLSAHAPGALDADDVLVAAAFARHVGVIYAAAELEANLHVALQTRAEVGQAVGILMERHRITADAAFDRLVAASRRTHRKLREIAFQVLETGEDPEAIGPN